MIYKEHLTPGGGHKIIDNSGKVLLTLSIFLIEGTDVKCIGCVYFAARGNQRRRILLLVNLVPIDAFEESMILQFFRSTSLAAQSLVHVSLEKKTGGVILKDQVNDTLDVEEVLCLFLVPLYLYLLCTVTTPLRHFKWISLLFRSVYASKKRWF